MMAIRKYTRDELLFLRDSPLVSKPDNLPAIEQWLEYVYVDKDSREKLRIPHSEAQQQAQHANQNKRQPQRQTAGEASPMGNFGAGTRPSLLSTRSHGGSKTGGESGLVYPDFGPGLMRARVDDVSLGPPKTVFASSRNVHKFGEGAEKNGDGEEQEGPRSRFFGDKSNRKSLNEKDGGHNRDSWTRKGLGDEEKPESRWGRREKDADGEKRNGFGDRQEARWGERRQNGERQGGWRDRERERREPEWTRDKPEKEPEWMDDPAPPNAEDDLRTMGMPRNQDEFQKWKEAMSGKKTQPKEQPPELEPAPPMKETTAPKATVPLKLDGVTDKPFGGWGDSKPMASTPEGAPASAKTATTKGKGSRFASMFKESQPKEEPPLVPETHIQAAANKLANGAAEDEAGFKRILQMLGNTNVSQPTGAPDGPSSPQPKANANGSVKQKSRFTGFFDQGAGPKSPERIQSPPEQAVPRHLEDMFPSGRAMPQEGEIFGSGPDQRHGDRARAHMSMTSPEPPPGLNGGNQRPQSGRMNDIFIDQPPSRGAGTPDINIQNLLASQRAQRPQGQDKNSEFLLNLLQAKGSSRPPSQQARPDNFPLWLDQPPNMPEPHAPKPRVPPPPGLFEDQLLRNAPPGHQQRQESQQMHGNEMPPQRRQSQRGAPGMPPGFYDEQNMYMQQQQQRRQFPDPSQHQQAQQQPNRRMSGHPNLPPMQIPPGMPPQQQQFGGGGPPQPPPEFLQSPTGAPGPGGPPPGFNPHMARHPPGLGNIPSIFQAPQGGGLQQQQQQQQQGGGRGEPPPGSGGHGGGGGMQSPPGMPPGFYGGGAPGVPPGFMGMRGGEGVGVGGPPGGRGRVFEEFEGLGGGRR